MTHSVAQYNKGNNSYYCKEMILHFDVDLKTCEYSYSIALFVFCSQGEN